VTERRHHVLVCAARADWALAEWLTLRLTEEGYAVWCDRFRMIAGDAYPRDDRSAIERDIVRFVPLLSRAAVRDADFRERCAIAVGAHGDDGADLVFAASVDGLTPAELGWSSAIRWFAFDERWEHGFVKLVEALVATGTPAPLVQGRAIAAATRRSLASRRSWPTSL
jgi:hypothetical protein